MDISREEKGRNVNLNKYISVLYNSSPHLMVWARFACITASMQHSTEEIDLWFCNGVQEVQIALTSVIKEDSNSSTSDPVHISVACSPFVVTLFASTKLSMNILGLSPLNSQLL